MADQWLGAVLTPEREEPQIIGDLLLSDYSRVATMLTLR
jgi:hypothetical protein